jgi:uncharacterized protein YjbK
MNELVLKGIVKVAGMKFNHIEGGFGKDKKAMLVKDIANIHNQPLGEVNRRINENRKRFKDGIDIIDLKGTDFVMALNHNGIYTQNAINRSANIYLLSERGYSKLLKILEDDVAWEQYEKLVDGYFHMRSEIRNIPEIKQKEVEARLNNSKARQANVLLKIADKINVPEYKQILSSYATKIITGEYILPLPETERTYTAGEIAEELGVTANAIGRIANANNLKTEEYGVRVWDKSQYSNKQVQSWRYNQKGKDKLIKLLTE